MEELGPALVGVIALYLIIYFAVLNAIRDAQRPKADEDKQRPWRRTEP